MEKVLDIYKRPYDPSHPVINMDESPVQLIGEIRSELPMEKGKDRVVDSEYFRNGVCEIFMAVEALAGNRIVKVTEKRTKKDWALFLKDIAQAYQHVQKITLIMDNLNTHFTGSIYEVFKPEEA